MIHGPHGQWDFDHCSDWCGQTVPDCVEGRQSDGFVHVSTVINDALKGLLSEVLST